MSGQRLRSSAEAAGRLSRPLRAEAALRRVAMLVAGEVPIVVGGATWGAPVAVSPAPGPLAPRATARLSDVSQLAAGVIASAQAREALRALAEQQGALRRIATLVGEGAEPKTVFTAVAVEAARVLDVGAVSLLSYDADSGMLTKIFGTHGDRSAAPDGSICPAAECPDIALVLATGRPARVDDWTDVPGPVGTRHRELGWGQGVAAPVIVDGSVWGFIGAYAETDEVLPAGCETRLADFTYLMATVISNVQARQARDEHRGLAESQGALRRVATIVAHGAEPRTVFTAVAIEAARVLGVGAVSLIHYDADTGMFTKIFGTHGQRAAVPDGGTWGLADCPEGALVLQTGAPVRIDDWTGLPGPVAARHREAGFGQAVAAPIILDGAIWGHIAAFGEADEILPPGCEARLADYTNLMASALANAQARDELRGLAEQQGAALRRVATLVAQQAPPGTIFNAVAGEAALALRVPRVDVGRWHGDGSVTLLGSTGRPRLPADHASPDRPAFPEKAEYVAGKVAATGRAARVDDWTAWPAPDAAAGEDGFRSVVGAPIMVEGAPWGVIVVLADEILPRDAETRLTDFTHLVASSISNVQARDSLIASRARVVTASDETRRRIERNLHDGIQQRVVSLALGLRAVRARFPLPLEVQAGLDDVARDLEAVLEEIRVFSQGLHPALLARSGLGPSLRALGRRSPIPVTLTVTGVPRLPEPIETAVYYVVSEALANAAKHSRASEVSVIVVCDGAGVRARVADDGVGGAAPSRGSGLIGLVDRVEALGGRLVLESPAGRGTTISIELPPESQTMAGRPAP